MRHAGGCCNPSPASVSDQVHQTSPLRRSLQTRYRGLEEEGSEGAGGGIGDGIVLVGAAAAAWRKLCRRESRMESKTRATFYVRKRRSQS